MIVTVHRMGFSLSKSCISVTGEKGIGQCVCVCVCEREREREREREIKREREFLTFFMTKSRYTNWLVLVLR